MKDIKPRQVIQPLIFEPFWFTSTMTAEGEMSSKNLCHKKCN